MNTMKKLTMIALCCAVAAGAYAESKPFQASLIPDIAIHSSDTHIKGVSLSIWGENPQTSLALGFVNGTTGDSSGISLGVLGNYAENYKGAQLAHFLNYTSGNFTGLQLAAVNYAGKLKGVQLGLVNYAEATDTGIQVGFVNIIKENTEWFKNFPDEVAPAMIFVNWRL